MKRMRLTKQEQSLILTFRNIEAKWERLAVALLIKSLVWGHLTKKTDAYSIQKMRRMVESI